jgi:hypothetical protein
MVSRMLRPSFALVLVAGCGGGSPNGSAGDMAGGGPTCATMGMDVAAYSGDAAGALALAGPAILAYAPDATLAGILGMGITQKGIDGGAWDVTYYSPSLNHNFIGAFGVKSGHVGCQDVTIKTPPPVEASPSLSSAKAAQAAVDRILVDSPSAMLPGQADGFVYGKFTNGNYPTHDKAWGITFQPWVVVVDDASGMAIECTRSGTLCR